MHVNIEKTLLRRATLLLISAACFVSVLFVFDLTPVFAQVAGSADDVAATAGLSQTDLPTMIGNIIHIFLSVLGVVLLILVLYAGYLWMTAQGDAEQTKKARDILIDAVIGLIIVLSSYAITSFIVNALTEAGGQSGSSSASSSSVSIERLSGSLGAGGLQDHYPARNATDIARNTRIFVTFKEAMDIESFIDGYSTAGTPQDVTDDTVATDLNTSRITIYSTAQGEGSAFDATEVGVSFTDDLKTFVFDPPLLGSATENTSYTVVLDDRIESADGESVLNNGGYEWSFEVGTEIDLTPPTVSSVVPAASGTYARNIIVEVTFSEAVDPTSASGIREGASGFSNIQTFGIDSIPVAGSYEISNGYRTITFISNDACGTNSCGETIYCLPGAQVVSVLVQAATTGSEPPQADFPYDGVADLAGNSLDGNEDGVAGDDHTWSFNTTNDIVLTAPVISSISPNISEEDVALDQEVLITFDGLMMTSTLTSSFISLTPDPIHEMWYRILVNSLDATGADVADSGGTATMSQIEISHGVFLESADSEDEGTIYLYATDVTKGVRNQYQNCFVPGEGPDASGGSCGTTATYPFCCNGLASATACSLF